MQTVRASQEMTDEAFFKYNLSFCLYLGTLMDWKKFARKKQ